MPNTTVEYRLSFATPAFLGNAQQQAQWRTPPIKALIRQWWRVVKAPQVGFDVGKLRTEEGALFGTASDDGKEKSHRSLVRLRLKHWSEGQLDNAAWPKHEMKNVQMGQGTIRADVYLGFGPVAAASKKLGRPEPRLERSAIDPVKQENELLVGFDRRLLDEQVKEVRLAVSLASWFGGVGSRSRNGWGSLTFDGDSLPRLPQSHEDIAKYCQPFVQCFLRDWPHAIGNDPAGPLVWVGRASGEALKNWREAVFFLATLRRDIRAAAKKFGRNRDISANQLIAYPVTKSNNTVWGDDERIAGSLRLKVVQTGKGFVPVAVHLPCAVPKPLFEKLGDSDQRWVNDNQTAIWAAVHKDIDRAMARLRNKQ